MLTRFPRFMGAAAAVLLMTSFSAPAHADAVEYKFDTVHSQIIFHVDHLGFSKREGEFLDFDGQFMFDEARPENSSVNVTIDTNSISMDDDKWEEHMKNADFFNVAQFPAMTFNSTSVEQTGANTGKIHGDLTLLGITKPVTLDVVFNKAGVHPYSQKYVAGFSATTALDRSAFGMNYGLPGIGDRVDINIEVEGIRAEAPVPADATASDAVASE